MAASESVGMGIYVHSGRLAGWLADPNEMKLWCVHAYGCIDRQTDRLTDMGKRLQDQTNRQVS